MNSSVRIIIPHIRIYIHAGAYVMVYKLGRRALHTLVILSPENSWLIYYTGSLKFPDHAVIKNVYLDLNYDFAARFSSLAQLSLKLNPITDSEKKVFLQ